MTVLHGLLVDLVPATSEYAEKMYQYWNNESKVWATMGDRMPTSRAQIERIRAHRAESIEHGYNGVHFMMRARDGNIIGTIGLNWVDEFCRSAALGAWIGEPDYWGGGYGSDALLLLVDYAFRWLDLRRLWLGTMSLNERAQRNVEKCGFTLEARMRQAAWVDGAWVDEVDYGMLCEEWPGREVLVERLGLREKAEKRYGKED